MFSSISCLTYTTKRLTNVNGKPRDKRLKSLKNYLPNPTTEAVLLTTRLKHKTISGFHTTYRILLHLLRLSKIIKNILVG